VLNGTISIAYDRLRVIAVIGLAQGAFTQGMIEFADEPPTVGKLILEAVFKQPCRALDKTGIRLFGVVKPIFHRAGKR